MSTQIITPEIVAPEQSQLVAVIQQNNLPEPVAQSLRSSFAPLFASAQNILEKSRNIVVTDAAQKLEIKLARECRLALRAVRVEGDKIRKSLKDQSLREGRAIDGFQNILLHLTESEEKRLDEQEKFVERKESERKAALKSSREAALAPFGVNTIFMSLADMPDDVFAQLLENTRAAHEAKLAAERKEEEDRIAAENARIKEDARIREENARLKREADEREAKAKKEREDAEAILASERAKAAKAKKDADDKAQAEKDAAEATLRAERAKAAKLLAEIQAAKDAETNRINAQKEAARKAAKAPDKEKVIAYARSVRALEVPMFSTNEANELAAVIIAQRNKFAAWIEEKGGAL